MELANHEGGVPVFERYGMGVASLGRHEWEHTARAALFNFHEKFPEDRKARKALFDKRKAELVAWLAEIKPRACIVLQTLSKTFEDSDLIGTTCWDAINGPGKITDAQGTAWLKGGCYYVPVLNYIQYDYVTRFYIRRWIRMACTLARGTTRPLQCQEKIVQPEPRAAEILEGYMHKPIISVDLESIPSKGIITAVNLSDGRTSLSLPWEHYQVYPNGEQPALEAYPGGIHIKRQILSLFANENVAKVGHNLVGFDTLELAKKGIAFRGRLEDTIIMHRMLHPQHRHALQIACATVLCVPPWKSMFKPVAKSKDSDEFWSATPGALRDYGADDAWFSYKLWETLEKDLA